MMPVYNTLWPLLHFFWAIQIVPRLATPLIKKSPAIDVSGLFFFIFIALCEVRALAVSMAASMAVGFEGYHLDSRDEMALCWH